MRLRPRLALCAASLAACLLATASAAEPHALNLTPPWKVGQNYSAEVTTRQTNRMALKSGAQVLNEQIERTVCRLQADGEALAVLDNGGLQKTRYVIRSLRVAKNDDAETDFLPAGTEVLVERASGAEETILVSGKPATPEQHAVLASLVSTDDTERTDQIIFGPRKPVAVGDTWSIDSASFARAMESSLGKIGDTKGVMKLDALQGKGDDATASVSGRVSFDLLSVPLPSSVTFKSGKAVFLLDGRIPASRPGAEMHQELRGNVEVEGESALGNGAVITLQIRSDHEQISTLRFR